MLLDRPLPLVERRGRAVQDVVGYLAWLHEPNRTFMKQQQVYDFVMQNINLSCSVENSGHEKQKKECSINGKKLNEHTTLPVKGRTRGAIIGFWGRGETGHFRHLNAAVAVTLRALYFEGQSQDEAVDLVISYVDGLDNSELSSRLPNNKSDIYRVIRSSANRIWDSNGGQVDSESSSRTWRAVIGRWREVGFKFSDKTTWVIQDARLGTVVDSDEFEFTEEERRLLVEEMAPLLVGKKQARRESKQEEVIRAVHFFLRYVKCHDGEIARDALPIVLRDFGVKLGMDSKKQAFLDLLRKWGWIYVRADYWHPAHQGQAGRGRARAYGIGPAMVAKFGSSSPSHIPHTQRIYILCSTCSGSLPEEVDVPCFEDFPADDFVVENQELLLEPG